MSKNTHLGALLAVTEKEGPAVKAILADYAKTFKTNQGMFLGERKTYEPYDGTVDIPANRQYDRVVTTVDEKFDYLIDALTPVITRKLSLERTNASGNAKADLYVDGDKVGEFTSLELLGLKNFFESPKLEEVIAGIPVRPEARKFVPSDNDEHAGRSIYQSIPVPYVEKTTEKNLVVLADPNVAAALAAGKEIKYTPVTDVLTTTVILGEGDRTLYSGAWSHLQRATALNKLAAIRKGIVEALSRANLAEVMPSSVPVRSLLEELFRPDVGF